MEARAEPGAGSGSGSGSGAVGGAVDGGQIRTPEVALRGGGRKEGSPESNGNADGEERSQVKVVLLDIEGTVCPISFVKDVLFPFFLKRLLDELEAFWDSQSLRPFIAAFPPEHRGTPEDLHAYCVDLVHADIKDPALKALQGHIWQRGYWIGQLKCPLFDDVARSMINWHDAGIKIVIYSSGSIQAQKLLFGHTLSIKTDLNPLISGYHDTTTAGPKTEGSSYDKIYHSFSDKDVPKTNMDEWLFLSDNVQEVDAAIACGMSAAVVVRDGNKPLSAVDRHSHDIIRHFGELDIPGRGISSPLLTKNHLKVLNQNIELHKLPYMSEHHTIQETDHAEKVVEAARNLRKLLEKDVSPARVSYDHIEPEELESLRRKSSINSMGGRETDNGLLLNHKKRPSADFELGGGNGTESEEELSKKLKN